MELQWRSLALQILPLSTPTVCLVSLSYTVCSSYLQQFICTEQ